MLQNDTWNTLFAPLLSFINKNVINFAIGKRAEWKKELKTLPSTLTVDFVKSLNGINFMQVSPIFN